MATLGKITNGASSSSSSTAKTAVSSATASSSGTVSAGHARAWLTATATVVTRVVIYADSSGAPGALLAQSDPVTISITAEAQTDYTFSGANLISIVNGTTYWVGLSWQTPSTSSINLSRDSTASGRDESSSFLPNPFGTPTVLTGPVDVYVDYTTVSSITGTASGALGTLAGTATGQRTEFAPATAALGTLSGTATGKRTAFGTATGALGTLAATSTGNRAGSGTAFAALGTLAGSAAGPLPTPAVVTSSTPAPNVFETVLVARTPAASGSAVLAVVDRIVADGVTYTEELNKPGSATLVCPIFALSSAVKGRLVDLEATPNEVWIYSNGVLSWAGELQSLQVQGPTVNLNCVGLLGYTARMGITSDTTYSATDQFTIAKGLVNTWQAQTYGNFGLVTSGIGTSGVVRDRTYLRADLKDVLSALTDLSNVIDGFDMWVDPSSRALTFAYPKRGANLTGSVFLDSRNIDTASVSQSVAPGDIVSDVGLTSSTQSTSGAQANLYSYRTTSLTQSTFGRCWAGISADSVINQATLDGRGDAFLATRGAQLLQPSLTVIPNVGLGVTPGAVHPGDTVAYSYDAGLGSQSGNYRLNKVTVAVDPNGTDSQPRMTLEFV